MQQNLALAKGSMRHKSVPSGIAANSFNPLFMHFCAHIPPSADYRTPAIAYSLARN